MLTDFTERVQLMTRVWRYPEVLLCCSWQGEGYIMCTFGLFVRGCALVNIEAVCMRHVWQWQRAEL